MITSFFQLYYQYCFITLLAIIILEFILLFLAATRIQNYEWSYFFIQYFNIIHIKINGITYYYPYQYEKKCYIYYAQSFALHLQCYYISIFEWTYFFTIMLTSLVFIFILENDYTLSSTRYQVIRYLVSHLQLAYYLELHKDRTFFKYNIIHLLFLAILPSFLPQSVNQFILAFGNRRAEIPSLKNILFYSYLQNFGISLSFYKDSSLNDYEKEAEMKNILQITQVFQLIFSFLWLNIFKFSTSLISLNVYFVVLIPYFTKVLVNFAQNLKYGPQYLTFIQDKLKIKGLNDIQIANDYLQINNRQKMIQLQFRDVQSQDLHRLFDIIYNQSKSNIICTQVIFKRVKNYFLVNKQQKLIYISMGSKIDSFLEFTFKLIRNCKMFNYKIKGLWFSISFLEVDRLKIILILNYDILPQFIAQNQIRLYGKPIFLELYKYIAFFKNIQPSLNFSPYQIFYDLYDV
ncbi:transmembrane protein, putative (macronuclear) [Tetrahymena thermophila SB210]|uniref:Transmembrane protein, putative n=1 Tax=Tetrahymena thermophila (strain SB210) TaxID=312017 RepID=W7XEQ1_TETTS|nr:transmembrane protein, putative [Tetrahymena thermophila SB210]EWS75213.1 transmembrane protein, putative [Tetrahymena thermophila SB210]|eukprot:XP_012652204.1 transmembrane protein, putative [Tetrahymena thermophila SB210]